MRTFWHVVFVVPILLVLSLGASPGVSAEPTTETREPRLSLHDAIQAAIDNNVNVRLLKERIVAAQSATSTSHPG